MSTSATPAFSELGTRAAPPTIAKLMAMALEAPDLLSLAAGFTDNGSLPCEEVRRITEGLTTRGTPDVLQYGTNQGRPRLRALLAEHCRRLDGRGTISDADVFITNGSQQALYLAMQVLADPGDIVLVDRPSYFVFLEMLQGLGLRAVSMPVDTAGKLDLDALSDLLASLDRAGERRRVKAVYFVSYFSNPSSRSLDAGEKAGLAKTLSAGGWTIPVLEDAAYRELHFVDPEPAPSLLCLPEWQAFPRLYLSTLTKPFATGLKVGYGICTDSVWKAKMLHVKGHHDFGTANFSQAILEEALSSGAYDRHLSALCEVYRRKGEALDSALRSAGLEEAGWQWSRPGGGLYLWLKGPAGTDTRLESAFCRRAIANGVLYVPGDLCFGDNASTEYVRLSFGVLPSAQLAVAGERFVKAALEA